MAIELRAAALAALCVREPQDKVAAVHALQASTWHCDASVALTEPQDLPGRPERPRLVAPQEVPQRPVGSVAGRVALLHALAHIEFNAINLALDAIWRFAGMPAQFYADWLQVAAEEALHFALLREHLQSLRADYGDLPAHDGLWQMAARTRGDVLARMALVPRTLEARGLDASPAIRAKLASVGDHPAAAIVDRILADEIGHVAIGNRWYRWCCAERALDPLTAYGELARTHGAPAVRGPLNVKARLAAGFMPEELQLMGGVGASPREHP